MGLVKFMSRPYRALYSLLREPRALPWAGMFSPFRAFFGSLVGVRVCGEVMSRPYRALYSLLRAPRALPWAGMCSPFRAGERFKGRRLRAAFKGIAPDGAGDTLKGCDIPARGNAPGMFGKKNIRPVGAGHSVSCGEGLCPALTGLSLFVMSVPRAFFGSLVGVRVCGEVMSRPYRALYSLLREPRALPWAGMCSPFRAVETFKGIALFRAILNTLKGCDIPARGNAPGMFGKKNIRPYRALIMAEFCRVDYDVCCLEYQVEVCYE